MKRLLLILLFSSALFAQKLTITTEDGFTLHGWLEKPKNITKDIPLVLFVHQFGADHTSWDAIAKKFNAKGYATLSVDLRGHGLSILQNGKENRVITTEKLSELKTALNQSDKKLVFENIPSDLISWLDLMEEDSSIDTEALYLFGSSLGAASIIPLLNEYEAKALVAISVGGTKSLKEDTDMALSTSMTKELFIVAKNDPLGAKERSLEYTQKSILGTALIISGDGHGTVLLSQVEAYIFTFIDNLK